MGLVREGDAEALDPAQFNRGISRGYLSRKGRQDVGNPLRIDVGGPQPWPKEQLDVSAPGR